MRNIFKIWWNTKNFYDVYDDNDDDDDDDNENSYCQKNK